MRLRHSRSLGSLSINGELHVVIYDIPGMLDGSAGAAGGLIWFREEARAALPGATRFQLVSTAGVRVHGRVITRHGLSAAVVVGPSASHKPKRQRLNRELAFAAGPVATSATDNELVKRSGLLAPQGT